MSNASRSQHSLHDLEGRWVDLYAILEVPDTADASIIRKRLSSCYAQASANVQHRDITQRCYYQRLIEETLPQGLRILINPTLRREYDAQRALHRANSPEAQDYALFLTHLTELGHLADENAVGETALAIDAPEPKAKAAFRLPWEEDGPAAPAPSAAKQEAESYFSGEAEEENVPIAVVKTRRIQENVDLGLPAGFARATQQPAAPAQPTPAATASAAPLPKAVTAAAPVSKPVTAAPATETYTAAVPRDSATNSPTTVRKVRAAPSASKVDTRPTLPAIAEAELPAIADPAEAESTPGVLSGDQVIQDELVTLQSVLVARRARYAHVERFKIEEPAPPQALVNIDPRCLSEMSRMLLAAIVGGALTFYIQLATISSHAAESTPPKVIHQMQARPAQGKSGHGNGKQAA